MSVYVTGEVFGCKRRENNKGLHKKDAFPMTCPGCVTGPAWDRRYLLNS